MLPQMVIIYEPLLIIMGYIKVDLGVVVIISLWRVRVKGLPRQTKRDSKMMLFNLLLCFGCLCSCMYAAKVRYSNEFVVEVKGGPEVADEIAQRHGFKNLGKVHTVTCICIHIIVSSQIVREGPFLYGVQYVRHVLFYHQSFNKSNVYIVLHILYMYIYIY